MSEAGNQEHGTWFNTIKQTALQDWGKRTILSKLKKKI
jgi:hypothetical protein